MIPSYPFPITFLNENQYFYYFYSTDNCFDYKLSGNHSLRSMSYNKNLDKNDLYNCKNMCIRYDNKP